MVPPSTLTALPGLRQKVTGRAVPYPTRSRCRRTPPNRNQNHHENNAHQQRRNQPDDAHPEWRLTPGQHGPLTGIHVILSNGGGDTERQHREAQILQTGLFYSAARFRIIEGSPEPAEWLEVFETDDPDPLHTYPRATRHTLPASQIQPQLSQSFRLAGTRTTNGT